MKAIATFLLSIGIVLSIGLPIWRALKADNEYSQTVLYYWSLADKASTIERKAEYVDSFVVALERAGLAGTSNALWLKNPNNSFDANLEALKTLKGRLHQIESMDLKSFEYQTAISQITAQEQGEAKPMLDVFEGCWYLKHHFWFWDWITAITVFFWIIVIGSEIAAVIWMTSDSEW